MGLFVGEEEGLFVKGNELGERKKKREGRRGDSSLSNT